MRAPLTGTFLVIVSLACLTPGVGADPIRVAVYSDSGTGKSLQSLLGVLKESPDLEVTQVKADEIQAGKLDHYHVLIFPGGSGGQQGKKLGEKGRQQVRDFVKKGGGYLGICAGAYLASSDYTWSLHILDARVVDRKHWARGYGNVALKITPRGQAVLGLSRAQETIYYHQGPLLAPGQKAEIPDYTTLATFEGEIAKNGAPKGVMPGTTAIAAGAFGKGHVLCFSPHPEKTASLKQIVHAAVVWAAPTNN